MNFDIIPQEERQKIAQAIMQKGICPICDMPMIKNRKKTHSKTKAIVCEELLREKLQVKRTTIKDKDGKIIEVDAKLVPKSDLEKYQKGSS